MSVLEVAAVSFLASAGGTAAVLYAAWRVGLVRECRRLQRAQTLYDALRRTPRAGRRAVQ